MMPPLNACYIAARRRRRWSRDGSGVGALARRWLKIDVYRSTSSGSCRRGTRRWRSSHGTDHDELLTDPPYREAIVETNVEAWLSLRDTGDARRTSSREYASRPVAGRRDLGLPVR